MGLLTALQTADSDSSMFESVTMLAFLVLFAKVGFDYWCNMYYYESLITDFLYVRR